MKPPRPTALIILDGWGISRKTRGNAIALARPPFYRSLLSSCRHTVIHSSGEAVGLPAGQMGNSEVGHTIIGAGRIVYQDFTRIDRAIADGSFFDRPPLLHAIRAVKESGGALHLMGLLSEGGIHSHINHLFALLKMAKRGKLSSVYLHAILDGRDTPPTSGLDYIKTLTAHCKKIRLGAIATVSGRYYAMDRDKRWDRIKKAYDVMVEGKGPRFRSALQAVRESYQAGVTDEFMVPVVITDRQERPIAAIQDRDAVIFMNFRADRAREITAALTRPDFEGFPRRNPPQLSAFVCMTRFDERLDLPVAFGPHKLSHILPQILSHHGVSQLRCAETEKYAHVTYFFNGGDEAVFPGEERVLIPSPRDVATYDQKPEMSAYEVTHEAVKRIKTGRYGFIVLNFANPDMIGHTGVLPAAIKAVEVVDSCLKKIVTAVRGLGGTLLITADHGNLEQMIDPVTGGPHTAHTTNPVPLICVGDTSASLRPKGTLADIAPTVLDIMGIAQPPEMRGQTLHF